MFATLAKLQAATTAARARTGDRRIGVRVEAGRLQIVTVTPLPDGTSAVESISDWVTADEAVAFLDAMI